MADHLNPLLIPSRRDFMRLAFAAGSGIVLSPLFSLEAQVAGAFCAGVTGK